MERHWQLLKEILALSTVAEDRHYYSGYQQTVYLDAFASRRIWDLLSEAQETGLPMVQARKTAGRVVVCQEPARVSVRVDRTGDDLLLVPTLLADGMPVAPEERCRAHQSPSLRTGQAPQLSPPYPTCAVSFETSDSWQHGHRRSVEPRDDTTRRKASGLRAGGAVTPYLCRPSHRRGSSRVSVEPQWPG
ncbi:hypothetical protein [Micromonospora sp. NPDC007230]|uniref:hypothetical protein n=1 Tax=Micromonospora sp. NPDC007230 TaxID=3364237 RepID=UPI0036A230D5